MAALQKFIDPQILATIDGLTLRVRRIVEGMFSGLHRSPYRGFSADFAEHREYSPGDDLRYLDWKVFARTDKYYLKQFDDETNMKCRFCLDVSPSMSFQGPQSSLSKLEYAQCLVATWSWFVLRQRDAAGVLTFDADVLESVAPSNQPTHLQHILRCLESVDIERTPKETDIRNETDADRDGKSGKTNLGAVLVRIAQLLRRRGTVFVVSDLLSPVSDTLRGMRVLSQQMHEVIVIHVVDRAEAELSYRGQVTFRGLEDASEVAVQASMIGPGYRAAFAEFCDSLQRRLGQLGVRYLRVLTDEPLDACVKQIVRNQLLAQ